MLSFFLCVLQVKPYVQKHPGCKKDDETPHEYAIRKGFLPAHSILDTICYADVDVDDNGSTTSSASDDSVATSQFHRQVSVNQEN